MLFIRLLFCIFFGDNDLYNFFILRLFLSLFLFVWARGTMPRFRCDKLMYFAWRRLLRLSLNYLLFLLVVYIYIHTVNTMTLEKNNIYIYIIFL